MTKFKTLLRTASALALLAGASVPAIAQDAAPSDQIVVTGHAAIGEFGIDLAARDPNTKPGDDFERYAAGKWLDTAKIPDDRPQTGSFLTLFEGVQSELQGLITDAPAGTKHGAMYASFMDEKRVEQVGLKPLMADLAEVKAVSDKSQFARYMGSTLGRFGIALVDPSVDADTADPTMNILWLSQGGIGLPEKAYYFNPQFAHEPTAGIERAGLKLEESQFAVVVRVVDCDADRLISGVVGGDEAADRRAEDPVRSRHAGGQTAHECKM